MWSLGVIIHQLLHNGLTPHEHLIKKGRLRLLLGLSDPRCARIRQEAPWILAESVGNMLGAESVGNSVAILDVVGTSSERAVTVGPTDPRKCQLADGSVAHIRGSVANTSTEGKSERGGPPTTSATGARGHSRVVESFKSSRQTGQSRHDFLVALQNACLRHEAKKRASAKGLLVLTREARSKFFAPKISVNNTNVLLCTAGAVGATRDNLSAAREPPRSNDHALDEQEPLLHQQTIFPRESSPSPLTNVPSERLQRFLLREAELHSTASTSSSKSSSVPLFGRFLFERYDPDGVSSGRISPDALDALDERKTVSGKSVFCAAAVLAFLLFLVTGFAVTIGCWMHQKEKNRRRDFLVGKYESAEEFAQIRKEAEIAMHAAVAAWKTTQEGKGAEIENLEADRRLGVLKTAFSSAVGVWREDRTWEDENMLRGKQVAAVCDGHLRKTKILHIKGIRRPEAWALARFADGKV